MKSKQLANVLIKMLGLYICLYAIPAIAIFIVYSLLPPFGSDIKEWKTRVIITQASAFTSGVQAGAGILIIVMSRKIAGFWFKNEDE
jgi:hypothetical protein